MDKIPEQRTYSDGTRRIWRFVSRYLAAIGGLAYGFSLGVRKSRHRALITDIAAHFGYRGVALGTLPRIAIDDLTRADTSIVLPVARGRGGNVSELELIVLARLVAERRPLTVFEIGTFDGRTTAALAANCPAGAKVLTLDLPPRAAAALAIEKRDASLIDKPESGAVFRGGPYAAKIAQLYGDSATYDFGPAAIDFAFIDGSHSFEYALSDSRRLRPLLRNGKGLIVWHDYGVDWEGVTRALDQLQREPDFSALRRVEGTSLAVLEIR